VDVVPLNDDEALVWNNLMQLVFTLPRDLGDDLERSCGLSSTDYCVLMHLSEAPGGQLYMSELASRANFSPSRITRVIDDLARIGLVERRRGSLDARTTFAALTKSGLAKLRRSWPHHVRSIRQRAFDHLTPEEVRVLGPILQRLADAGRIAEEPTTAR
jgi:DNA-binding MarR family transcriptional regulator